LIAKAEAVICLAGVTAAPSAWGQAGFEMNVDIGLAVAEAAQGRRVLLASTQAVYGPTPGPHSEAGPVAPANPYGQSKLAMEHAVADRPEVTCLRLGNVIGADMLGRNLAAGRRLTLDQFADGRTPRRSYIDPLSLAQVLDALLVCQEELPAVLNVARAPTLEMGALLTEAGVSFGVRPAPPGALPVVSMTCSNLFTLVPEMAAPLSAGAAVANWQSLGI
jgi:nucleoside-diphosphate-sugar epimerase